MADGDRARAAPRALVWYRRGAGALAALIGACTIFGWRFGNARLTRLVDHWPTMTPTMAMLCVLAGTALVLAGAELGRRTRVAGRVVAALSGALALALVTEHLTGRDFGLDRVLAGASTGLSVGRAAVGFLLAAAANLILDRNTRNGASPAQILALGAGSIACVALLGYVFGVRALHTPPASEVGSGMAVHTAVALLLVASGLLAARPHVGLVEALTCEHAGGMVSRRLFLGLLAFIPVTLLVVVGRRLGWYGDPGVTALLVFLALVEGAVLIEVTAMRLNAYDLRQKETERQLRDSEGRFSQLIAQAPEGIFICDLEGRYLDVNAAGCRLLGRAREDIVGKNVVDFVPPEDVDRLWRVRDELKAGGVSVAEWLVRQPDGHYVPTEVSATILPDGQWQAYARDITERKRAEAALRELERLREEWATVIAHDLRQPVSAIALSAESLRLLAGAEASERQRSAIARIGSAAGRLNRMIEDLFDASRIEAKRLSVAPSATDVAGLLRTVAETLRETTDGHEIVVEAEPGLRALVDSDRIQQVLTNLVTNAAKYGDPGTEIRLDAAAQDGVVEVSVTNRGPAIPAEEIPRLFSRFNRAPSARAAGTPGTGLGLYIAKGLVEAHGGRIWVDSAPGAPTTFHFVVPRAAAGA
jgi:PAS domain S-box-containing protein